MTDTGLFDREPHARATDPGTSHAAAASIDPGPGDAAVVEALQRAGSQGATLDDLLAAIPWMEKVSLSPRLKPLEEQGRVLRSSWTRTGAAGKAQTVWFHPDHRPPEAAVAPAQATPRRGPVDRKLVHQAIADMYSAELQMRAEGRALFAGKINGWAELLRHLL